MNELVSCRILQDRVAQLQKIAPDAEDPMDRELRARQLHNSGNLECAEGNWNAAIEKYKSNTAIENYKSSNAIKTLLHSSIQGHCRAHLCLGRAYYFKGDWDNAREQYGRAEKYFDRRPSSAWIAQ